VRVATQGNFPALIVAVKNWGTKLPKGGRDSSLWVAYERVQGDMDTCCDHKVGELQPMMSCYRRKRKGGKEQEVLVWLVKIKPQQCYS